MLVLKLNIFIYFISFFIFFAKKHSRHYMNGCISREQMTPCRHWEFTRGLSGLSLLSCNNPLGSMDPFMYIYLYLYLYLVVLWNIHQWYFYILFFCTFGGVECKRISSLWLCLSTDGGFVDVSLNIRWSTSLNHSSEDNNVYFHHRMT